MVPNIVLILILAGLFLFQRSQFQSDRDELEFEGKLYENAANILGDLAASQSNIREDLLSYGFAQSEVVLGRMKLEERRIQGNIAELEEISTTKHGRVFLKRFVERRSGIVKIRADLVAAIDRQQSALIQAAFVRWSIKARQIDATLADLMFYKAKGLERSDTGSGMAKEVMKQAFDPFFTTKDIGAGSGLGLSMVYGFAKQSGGLAAIYTEEDQGTTVKVYLPKDASDGSVEDARAILRGKLPTGDETILVVEDEPGVLKFVSDSLRPAGYTVLEAADGPTALMRVKETPKLDMLLTDVVLPFGMTGRQIADNLWADQPDLKVLFTSGYAKNAIVHQGRLDEGVELLMKPYTRDILVRRVRFVLDDLG